MEQLEAGKDKPIKPVCRVELNIGCNVFGHVDVVMDLAPEKNIVHA